MSFLLGGVLPPQKCFCGTTRKFVVPSFNHVGAKEAHGRRVHALKEPEIESVEELEGDMENQSTASLYARFDSLLDNTMQDYNLGDSVRGIVATWDPLPLLPLINGIKGQQLQCIVSELKDFYHDCIYTELQNFALPCPASTLYTSTFLINASKIFSTCRLTISSSTGVHFIWHPQ